MSFELDSPSSPLDVLQSVGFTDQTGLVLIINSRAIRQQEWNGQIVNSGDQLSILSVLEGG